MAETISDIADAVETEKTDDASGELTESVNEIADAEEAAEAGGTETESLPDIATNEIADYDENEQSTGYALLTVNTYLYAGTASAKMIGRFAQREIVLLPDGENDGLTAIRFSYNGTTYTAAIDSADIMDTAAEPTAVTEDGTPVVNELEEYKTGVQTTPEEWLEQNAEQFFPRKIKYEEGIMSVGSMDLGITSKMWIRGGITPTYAYIDCDESVMIMNTPSTFNIEIGGFEPAEYVYSIFDQEFDDKDNYYYADIYRLNHKFCGI